MNELEVHIEALRRDRSHGASQLAGRALMIMKYAAGNANCNTKAEFFEYMQNIAGKLAEARPAMVAISNSVEQLMQILLPLARSEHDVAEVRSFTVQAAADLITSIQEAKSHAIQNGADLIHDGALVYHVQLQLYRYRQLESGHSPGQNIQGAGPGIKGGRPQLWRSDCFPPGPVRHSSAGDSRSSGGKRVSRSWPGFTGSRCSSK